MGTNEKVRNLTLFAMFLTIILILSFTPLGFISIGFIGATTVHIPVIVGAIILGPKFGAELGFCFGLISCIKATVSGNITGFLFSPLIPVPGIGRGSLWALAVAFVPRILIGIVSYYVYAGLRKLIKNETVSMGVAAFCGSFVNTALVMGLIYVIFKDAYAGAIELGGKTVEAAIGATVVVNGIPEAIIAVAIATAVCKALKVYQRKKAAK